MAGSLEPAGVQSEENALPSAPVDSVRGHPDSFYNDSHPLGRRSYGSVFADKMDLEEVNVGFNLAGNLTEKFSILHNFRAEAWIPLIFDGAGLAGRMVNGVLPVIDPATFYPLFGSRFSVRVIYLSFQNNIPFLPLP